MRMAIKSSLAESGCIQMFPITKPVIASELQVSVWSSK